MNQCSKCKISKPINLFYKNQTWCKQCHSETNREYYLRNREQALRWRRDTNLKRTYGISLEEYEVISSKQNDVCAICLKPESGKTQYGVKNLAVDHCHKTGKVRGLLCEKCNRAIGQLHDDIGIMQRAIEYLKKY